MKEYLKSIGIKILNALRVSVFLLVGMTVAYVWTNTTASGFLDACVGALTTINIFVKAKFISELYMIKNNYHSLFVVTVVVIGLDIIFLPICQWAYKRIKFGCYTICNLCYKDRQQRNIFALWYKSILLDGQWGSGKTYYYNHEIRPYLTSKPIYISCFSATREQLITQLMISNPLFNILSLHGILSGLMKNSWQSFMPKNDIVVFDDLERLHGADDKAYSDLIGIMNFLKYDNGCRLLLICNRQEIGSKVFSAYLEKVLDYEIEKFNPKENIEKVLKEARISINAIEKLLELSIEIVTNAFLDKNYFNLRIIKSTYIKIFRETYPIIIEGIPEKSLQDIQNQEIICNIYKSYLTNEIHEMCDIHSLYMTNFDNYLKARELSKSILPSYSFLKDDIKQKRELDNRKIVQEVNELLDVHYTESQVMELHSKYPEKNIISEMLKKVNVVEYVFGEYLDAENKVQEIIGLLLRMYNRFNFFDNQVTKVFSNEVFTFLINNNYNFMRRFDLTKEIIEKTSVDKKTIINRLNNAFNEIKTKNNAQIAENKKKLNSFIFNVKYVSKVFDKIKDSDKFKLLLIAVQNNNIELSNYLVDNMPIKEIFSNPWMSSNFYNYSHIVLFNSNLESSFAELCVNFNKVFKESLKKIFSKVLERYEQHNDSARLLDVLILIGYNLFIKLNIAEIQNYYNSIDEQIEKLLDSSNENDINLRKIIIKYIWIKDKLGRHTINSQIILDKIRFYYNEKNDQIYNHNFLENFTESNKKWLFALLKE
ncbi:MAG: hypothetical protein EKK54_07400 [Neisseriaceae bacterium]|nr:MAG: hypothetical protein EKK54_07400 [Neisseriaceae bacterium]